MEPEDSLPCSQKPANFPHSKPYPSSLRLPQYFWKIHFVIMLPSMFSDWCLSVNLLHQFSVCIFVSPIGATCPAHLILRDLITIVKFGEKYKSWSPSLCNFLQSPSTSYLWGPIVILIATFLNALSFFSSLNVRDKA